MKLQTLLSTTLAGLLLAGSLGATRAPANADTASTAAIVAGAAAIVGALLYDSSSRPYYVRDNHRYYVSQPVAQYYRGHHHVVQRRAYVPENEYPIARGHNPYIDHP